MSDQSQNSAVSRSSSSNGSTDSIQRRQLKRHSIDVQEEDELYEAGPGEFLIQPPPYRQRSSKPYSYASFVGSVFSSMVLVGALNPGVFITSPGSAFYSVWMYAVVWTIVFPLVVCVDLFQFCEGNRLLAYFSNKYAEGFCLVNCFYPEMFNAIDTVRAATKVLSQSSTRIARQNGASNKGHRTFDVTVAKTLLLMSALMYERDDHAARKSVSKHIAQVSQILLQAEKKIHAVAQRWGLAFVSINDFPRVSVCFSGAFYPRTGKPFLVLCFKGTSPMAASEFLIDATFAQEDCGDYLDGAAHQGFYTSLFPAQDSIESEVSPYHQIASFISENATKLKKKAGSNEPVPVWVTGHSLGSGLAALLYYRFLKHPDDLGPDAVLRDGFLFGNPRMGNAEFVSAFENLMSDGKNAHRSMWRVSNQSDLVARVPPGLADRRSQRVALSGLSLLNYGFISSCHVDLVDKPPYVKFEPERPSHPLGPQDRSSSQRIDSPWTGDRNAFNPIWVLEAALRVFAPPIYDHFPSNYWHGLCRIAPDEIRPANKVMQ